MSRPATVSAAGRRRAYREMALAGVLWGTIGPSAAIIHDHTALSSLQTSFWRLLVAVVPVTLLAAVVTRGSWRWHGSLLAVGLAIGAVTGLSQLTYFAAVASA